MNAFASIALDSSPQSGIPWLLSDIRALPDAESYGFTPLSRLDEGLFPLSLIAADLRSVEFLSLIDYPAGTSLARIRLSKDPTWWEAAHEARQMVLLLTDIKAYFDTMPEDDYDWLSTHGSLTSRLRLAVYAFDSGVGTRP